MIDNEPKKGKLKIKSIDVTASDIKAAKSALMLYKWINKKERKVKKNVRKLIGNIRQIKSADGLFRWR